MDPYKIRLATVDDIGFVRMPHISREACVISNHLGQIILFNKPAEKLFGYQSSEVLNTDVTLLMPERYRCDHLKAFARSLSLKKMWDEPKDLQGHLLRADDTEVAVDIKLILMSIPIKTRRLQRQRFGLIVLSLFNESE